MNDSFHYLSMANHMMVQKKLMEQLRLSNCEDSLVYQTLG